MTHHDLERQEAPMSMLKRMRARVTSAHVIAMIALFVALGGSSYAAVTISASQIANNSIPGSKLKANSVPASKLRNNSITGGKLRNNTISRAKLRTDALVTNGGGNITTPESSTGTTGPRGPQGPAGPRGLTGATGATGAQGAQGAQGDTGAQGAAGVSQFVPVSNSATVDATGSASTSVSCGDGQALYGTNFTTSVVVPQASAVASAPGESPSYTVTITAAEGTVLEVYGICGPA
jgi:hypothetical protein